MRVSPSLASIVAIASLAGTVVTAPSPLAASATDNTPPSVPPAAGALPLSNLPTIQPLPRRASSLETRQLSDLLNTVTAPLEPILDKVLELLGLKSPDASTAASQLSPEQVSHITAYVKNLTDSGTIPSTASLSGLESLVPGLDSLPVREEQ